METPFQAQVEIDKMGPEVSSYIYQTILELEPYTTPETVVTVVAKDPLKLAQLERFEDMDSNELKKLWRISIRLSEDGSEIAEEGVHEDIYQAIHLAKQHLLKTLSDIQDSVISTQDRMLQINNALAGTQLH